MARSHPDRVGEAGADGGRQVGDAGRAIARWTEAAGDSLARGTADYLQKDSKVLPTADEVREFTRKVDELVNDVERAEARVQRLKENS